MFGPLVGLALGLVRSRYAAAPVTHNEGAFFSFPETQMILREDAIACISRPLTMMHCVIRSPQQNRNVEMSEHCAPLSNNAKLL